MFGITTYNAIIFISYNSLVSIAVRNTTTSFLSCKDILANVLTKISLD